MIDDPVLASKDVMLRHVSALNSRDLAAIAETLRFPHFRLSGENVKTWKTPDSYLSDFHASVCLTSVAPNQSRRDPALHGRQKGIQSKDAERLYL